MIYGIIDQRELTEPTQFSTHTLKDIHAWQLPAQCS